MPVFAMLVAPSLGRVLGRDHAMKFRQWAFVSLLRALAGHVFARKAESGSTALCVKLRVAEQSKLHWFMRK